MSRFTALLLLAIVGLLAACRDEAAERFARARLTYENLLESGTRPSAKEFDPVIADLAAVPRSSRHYAEAQRLLTAINLGRTHVRTPLALAPKTSRSPELDAQLRACARLAELIGVDGGVDRHGLEALEKCRRRAEELELRYAHGDDEHAPDGGGAP